MRKIFLTLSTQAIEAWLRRGYYYERGTALTRKVNSSHCPAALHVIANAHEELLRLGLEKDFLPWLLGELEKGLSKDHPLYKAVSRLSFVRK